MHAESRLIQLLACGNETNVAYVTGAVLWSSYDEASPVPSLRLLMFFLCLCVCLLFCELLTPAPVPITGWQHLQSNLPVKHMTEGDIQL